MKKDENQEEDFEYTEDMFIDMDLVFAELNRAEKGIPKELCKLLSEERDVRGDAAVKKYVLEALNIDEQDEYFLAYLIEDFIKTSEDLKQTAFTIKGILTLWADKELYK